MGENTFCSLFMLEFALRVLAFKRCCDSLKDSWIALDSILVLTNIFDTWCLPLLSTCFDLREYSFWENAVILRVIRLGRLFRTMRLLKLMRTMPELIVLIKGLVEASRTVFFTLIILISVVYIFAVGYCQAADDMSTNGERFESVLHGMLVLLLEGVLPDQGPIVRSLWEDHWLLGAFALVFILIASLSIMNLLVGVLVEVIKVVSAAETEHLQFAFVKDALDPILMRSGAEYDEDGDALIRKTEFENILMDEYAITVLNGVGVDVLGLVHLSEHIYSGIETIKFPDFCKLVFSLRGSKQATVADVVDLRKVVVQEISSLGEGIEKLISSWRDFVEGMSEVSIAPPQHAPWPPSCEPLAYNSISGTSSSSGSIMD